MISKLEKMSSPPSIYPDQLSTTIRDPKVEYCKCHLPMDYCKFSPYWKTICQPFRASNSSTSSSSERSNSKGISVSQKALKKASKKPITIFLLKRTQSKTLTNIVGLDDHGYSLKEASKKFGKKFSTGCGLVKESSQIPRPHLQLQGDFGDQVLDLLVTTFKIPREIITTKSGKAKGRKKKKGPPPGTGNKMDGPGSDRNPKSKPPQKTNTAPRGGRGGKFKPRGPKRGRKGRGGGRR